MNRLRSIKVRWALVASLVLVGAGVWWLTGAKLLEVALAVIAGWLMLKVGFTVLTGLATPPAPPPPPGELRKVKITFRCSICGTEVRMTSANDEVPEPPRHCQDDMDLVAPVE